ncbi:MAG: hypothetical protein RBS24_05870 [Bacilli bacterium]|jgi:hypothetical protein|nr:hypothetical protein [Bacilli bacterium]
MAEGIIKYTDLFDADLIAKITALKTEIDALRESAKQIKTAVPKTGAKAGDTEKLNKVQAERIRLQERLNSLESEEAKANLELKQQIADKLRQQKEEIKLSNQKAGSLNSESAKLKKLKEDYRNLSAEERNNVKVGGEMLKNIQEQDKKMKSLDGSMGDHQRNVGDYKNSIIGAFQQMGIPIGGVTKLLALQTTAQEGLTAANAAGTKGLKLFKIALLATGIGAIVVAIGALAAGFLSTQRGVDAVNKVLIPLKVVMQRLWGIVQELGTAIVDAFSNPQQTIKDLWQALKENIINRITGIADQFKALGKIISSAFSLNWEGVKEGAAEFGESTLQVMTGVDDLTGKVAAGFKSLGAEISLAADEGARLAEIKKELEELAITTALEEGKLSRTFQEQREILNDVNKSNKERLIAANKAIEASGRSKDLKLQELALLIEEQQLKMKQNDSDREAQLELAKLQAQRDEIEADNIKENLRIRNTANGIIKAQEAERLKAAADIAAAQKKEAEDYVNFQKEIDSQLSEMEDEMIADEIKKAQTTEDELNKILAERLKDDAKLKNKALKEESDRQEKIRDSYNNTASAIGEALGEMIGDSEVSFKDFGKKMLIMMLDVLEKQTLIYMAGAVGTEAASKPFPANLLTAALKVLAIKTAFTAAKAAVSKFERGEVDIQGRRHSQGGILAEIEGGESVINRTGTARSRETLELINSGLISDKDIIPALALNFARVPKVNVNNDFSLLASKQDQTNELLKKFKFMSADGRKVMDINGNLLRYV